MTDIATLAISNDTTGLKKSRLKAVLRELVAPDSSVILTFPDNSRLIYHRHYQTWRKDTLSFYRD